MAVPSIAYQVSEIPDPTHWRFRAAAGPRVFEEVCAAAEQLLRVLGDMPSGSAHLEFRYVFRPLEDAEQRQDRLALYVIVQAADRSVLGAFEKLLSAGPMRFYYPLRRCPEPVITRDEVPITFRVARRTGALRPLLGPRDSVAVPDAYYTIEPFEPAKDNRYYTLDRVLGSVNEAVVIRLRAEPADISQIHRVFTQYLGRLAAVNRTGAASLESDLGLRSMVAEPSRRGRAGPAQPRVRQRGDPLAKEILRQLNRSFESLQAPHLGFRIEVRAESRTTARLLGSVLGDSAFEQGSYCLLEGDADGADPDPVPARPDHDKDPFRLMLQLGSVAPVDELASAFRLPIASEISPSCIRMNTDPPVPAGDRLITIGRDLAWDADGGNDAQTMIRRIPVDSLTKHAFISGIPGQWKSTEATSLLVQLHAMGIPFLVIESAKTEYRELKRFGDHQDPALRNLARTLELYTPGNEAVSPQRFNPLKLLDGIDRDEHIDALLEVLWAAVAVDGSLPGLIDEALEETYASRGEPTLVDLIEKVRIVFESKGYSADTGSDMRAAIETRLGPLARRGVGKLFQCRKSVPSIAHVVRTPTAVELSRLSATASRLWTLFTLKAIRTYFATHPPARPGELRYVVFLEEAGNVIGRTGEARPDSDVPDPKRHVTEEVCRILAELRGLGVGIVIINQLPSNVAPDVLSETATKLTFRLIEEKDREALGRSMRCTSTMIEDLACLEPGQALLFSEGYYRPQRIQIQGPPDLRLGAPPTDQQLRSILREEPWFAAAAEARRCQEILQLGEAMDRFNEEVDRLRGQVERLVRAIDAAAEISDPRPRANRRDVLAKRVAAVSTAMRNGLRGFERGPYRHLRGPSADASEDPEMVDARRQLTERFEKLLKPNVEACLERLETRWKPFNDKESA